MKLRYVSRATTRAMLERKVRAIVRKLVNLPGNTVDLHVVGGADDHRLLQTVAYLADVSLADKTFTAGANRNESADVVVNVVIDQSGLEVDVNFDELTLTITVDRRRLMDDVTLFSDAVRENVYGRRLIAV